MSGCGEEVEERETVGKQGNKTRLTRGAAQSSKARRKIRMVERRQMLEELALSEKRGDSSLKKKTSLNTMIISEEK